MLSELHTQVLQFMLLDICCPGAALAQIVFTLYNRRIMFAFRFTSS